tara:strand:- start:611 stop:805 length:195 start_codon:yes stop_codon:yes gene_type:complete
MGLLDLLDFNIPRWSGLSDKLINGSMEDESIETQIKLANIVNPTRSQDEDITFNFQEEISYDNK